MNSGVFRFKEFSTRIELSTLVLLLKFHCFGCQPSWGGGGGGGGGNFCIFTDLGFCSGQEGGGGVSAGNQN